jgi:hypothetical protein
MRNEGDETDPAKLLADLRDLIEIIDRRMTHLREHGNLEAVQQMDDIRRRAVETLEGLRVESDDPQNDSV